MNTYPISSIPVFYLISIILNGTINHVMAMEESLEEPLEDLAALTTSATQQLERYNDRQDDMHEDVHYHLPHHSPQPASYHTSLHPHPHRRIADEQNYTNPPQRYASQTYPGFAQSQEQPPRVHLRSSADASQPQTRHIPLPASSHVSLPPISAILDGLAVQSSTSSAAAGMSGARQPGFSL